MRSPHRFRSRWLPAGDAGVSLMELLVSLAVMSVLGSLFTAGILQMYGTTNWVEARSTSQSQIHTMFMRLDKQIRYASAIAPPASIPSGWYVEYAFLDTHTDPAARKCTELWMDPATRTLWSRTWDEGSPSGDFVVLTSGVASAQPFALPSAPASDVGFQRLQISLKADAGPGSTGKPRTFDMTFTALNTSATSDAGTCAAERPVA